VHFRHVSATIYPKSLKQHFDWKGNNPPSYALAQDLKKCSLTEKNQVNYADFAQSFLNYADN